MAAAGRKRLGISQIPVKPRYPVYVISKGRADCCVTARLLKRDGVSFRLVVEPQEQKLYASEFGAEQLEVLPFSNLGLGSIPARNWVWEHAKASGAEKHWIMDDNIWYIYRVYRGQRLQCNGNIALGLSELFLDRYENIAIGGLNYAMFVPRGSKYPFAVNVHVYSTLLIRNDLPYRWRGRYNEDTDLCLQVLSGGWCTVLLNAFLIKKTTTMTMKGGNMTSLYQGDGRLRMARSLERVWPGIVEVKRRFQRPQHVINWGIFTTPLKLKPGLDLTKLSPNEFGMKLTQVKPIKSPIVQKLFQENQNAAQK